RLYPGITIMRLRRNHRCTPQIVDTARKVLDRAGQADDSVADAADGLAPRIISHADDSSENAGVASLVRELAGVHRPWRSCAILARTQQQLTAVGRALERAGVPARSNPSSRSNKSLGAALNEAYAQRSFGELATWIDIVMAEGDIDPIRARVAEA